MADHIEERTPSDSILLRLGSWGTAAAVALGTFAFAAQGDANGKRLQLALEGSFDDAPYQSAAAVPAKPDPAVKLLQAKLDRLDSDRVRIDARLTTLEHGLDDVTGSIRRQAPAPTSSPPAPKQTFIEPPVIPKVETLPTASPLIPKVETLTTASETKVASIAPSSAEPPPDQEQAAAAAEPVLADEPMPRRRPIHHPGYAEYGVELGTAPDVEALRERWVGIKANFGPLLVGMNPVGVKDRHPGSTKLRLIAGPVKSLAAARELCARFVAAKGYCWPMRVNATDVVMR